jgi:TonB family protein
MALRANDPRQDCRRVRLSDALVNELRSIATAGLGGLTGDGVETGGLLMGRIVGDELYLDSCEEAPLQHRDGPSYTLNASDRIRLDEILASRRRVEGFFRTLVAHDPTPQDADEPFVRRYFPYGDCIYLMMRAVSADECVALVNWFRDGRLFPLVEQSLFQLQSGKTPVIRVRATLPPSARNLHPEPAAGRRRRWAPILACLLLGLAGGVGWELWSFGHDKPGDAAKSPVVAAEVADAQTPRPSSWTDLQLDARPDGKQLAITWSAAAVKDLHSSGGRLEISDGGARQEIKLSGPQVRAGAYRYTISHSDVAVRLIATDEDGRGIAGDSVRLESSGVAVPPPQSSDTKAGSGGKAAVPPETLHEVQPTIPEGIRSRLSAEVVIPVDVQVSERGRVLSAQVHEANGDGIHRYLADQAEKAARGWQFSPARTRDGAPVAASKTIEFIFTP